jgi:hypothetical protein
MELNEEILKMKKIMGILNESKDPKPEVLLRDEIIDDFKKIREKIPPQKVEVIDIPEILNNIQNYLIGKIPEIIKKIKIGQGGAEFAYSVKQEILKNIDEQIKRIGGFKKFAIRKLAPSEKEFIKISNNYDYNTIVNEFINITDFGFEIGWIDEMKPYEDNWLKWSKEKDDWVYKNAENIKNEIVNRIIVFLYR